MDDSSRRTMRTLLGSTPAAGIAVVVSVLLLGSLSGCGDEGKKGPPPTFEFPLEVSATDETGEPVARAPVLLDGKVVGYTDRDGLFEGKVTERRKAEISLAVKAPDGYKLDGKAQKTAKLKLKKSVTGDGVTGIPVALQASMRSTTKDFLLWIELQCDEETLDEKRCADVPVMIDGKEIARTNSEGIAHATITRTPSAKIDVKVDTPTYQGDDEDEKWVMKPEDPNWSVELGTDSQVLVFENAFKDPIEEKRLEEEREREERLRRIRRRRRREQRQKEQEKEDDTIQLF